ncbi:hypothetical protein B0H17DRAFT_1202719 [Mycena rosella]|uniref:Uncharacterized protein n=1 Tax=Mycena rosella TaxID=1033263 RepID=A0AAD7DGA7_MYCRO|nr:hypothetical protein B0H17DRAFT_1202719 [Mycena rosella]
MLFAHSNAPTSRIVHFAAESYFPSVQVPIFLALCNSANAEDSLSAKFKPVTDDAVYNDPILQDEIGRFGITCYIAICFGLAFSLDIFAFSRNLSLPRAGRLEVSPFRQSIFVAVDSEWNNHSTDSRTLWAIQIYPIGLEDQFSKPIALQKQVG